MVAPKRPGIATNERIRNRERVDGSIETGMNGSKCGACSEAPEEVLEEVGEGVTGTARFRRGRGVAVHDVSGPRRMGVMCLGFGLRAVDRPGMRRVGLRRPGMMGGAEGGNGRADPGGGIEETRDVEDQPVFDWLQSGADG